MSIVVARRIAFGAGIQLYQTAGERCKAKILSESEIVRGPNVRLQYSWQTGVGASERARIVCVCTFNTQRYNDYMGSSERRDQVELRGEKERGRERGTTARSRQTSRGDSERERETSMA